MQEGFSIQPYLNDADILHQTAEQIKKDFSFFDIAILFDNGAGNAYEELCKQILPSVVQLVKSANQKLYAFLYRVDISEMQIKNESARNPEKTFEEIITGLIIKRCLQKVVLRKLFS